MNMPNAGRFVLRMRFALLRTGVLPCVVAVSLVAAAGIWAQAAVQALSRDVSAIATSEEPGAPPRTVATFVPPAVAPADNLRVFQATLGDAGQAEQYVRKLFSLAGKAGIDLVQGDYKWELDRASNTYRYQILFPVKGSYGAIRNFCEQALRALPFAALDELTLKRESVAEEDLDSSVRFTLFLAGAAAAAPDTGRAAP